MNNHGNIRTYNELKAKTQRSLTKRFDLQTVKTFGKLNHEDQFIFPRTCYYQKTSFDQINKIRLVKQIG